MASTSSSNPTIQQSYVPIFYGENYDFWCVKMKTLFISLDLWDLIENGVVEPASTSTLTEQEQRNIKEKKQRNANAFSKIQQGVSNNVFPRIIGATKAKEAWEILQEEFKGSVKVRASKLQDLRKDFENVRMKENETMQEFSDRYTELVNQMKIYGEEVENKKLIEKVLGFLPEKFDPIVSVIEETKDLDSLTLQDLMGSLKSFKRKLIRRSEKSLDSAFQSKLNVGPKTHDQGRGESFRGGRQARGRGRGWNFRGRGRGSVDRSPGDEGNSQKYRICKRSNHVEENCWFKGKPQCHNCKKFGHLQRDCRFKNTQQASRVEEKDDEANLFYACQNALEQENEVWFLDSGCTNHMTGNKSIFHKMDASISSQVKMGNGVLVQVKGKGTIGVQTKRGVRYISDVLLVPDLEQNLLSVGQLLENGYSLKFERNGCVIFDKQHEKLIVADIKMKNRSFMLKFQYAKDVALKTETMDESWLWHRRFGHLNFGSLKLLH